MTVHMVVGCDHGGVELKDAIKSFLAQTYPEMVIDDIGTHTTDSVDYPLMADALVAKMSVQPESLGVLVCGTGIGISIRANRHPRIRAALVHDQFTAEMAKAHNNANVLCFGGRTTSVEDAQAMVETWLKTDFEGGRHQRRVDLLSAPI